MVYNIKCIILNKLKGATVESQYPVLSIQTDLEEFSFSWIDLNQDETINICQFDTKEHETVNCCIFKWLERSRMFYSQFTIERDLYLENVKTITRLKKRRDRICSLPPLANVSSNMCNTISASEIQKIIDDGDYTIISKLTSPRENIVIKFNHNGKEYALKMLTKDCSDEIVQQLTNEAKVYRRLSYM